MCCEELLALAGAVSLSTGACAELCVVSVVWDGCGVGLQTCRCVDFFCGGVISSGVGVGGFRLSGVRFVSTDACAEVRVVGIVLNGCAVGLETCC